MITNRSKHIVEYQEFPTATRAIAHNESLPVPTPPGNTKTENMEIKDFSICESR